MKINSHNEWDTLREVIIGRPNARANLIFKKPVSKKVLEQAEQLAYKAYPQKFLDETIEDLEGLIDVIKDFGVKIFRPDTEDIHRIFTTPYFNASAEHAYNPRDLFLIVGDTIIETPSQERHRYFESQAYYNIFHHYFNEGSKWISAPKPRLKDKYRATYYKDNHKNIKLLEKEILFEAATIVRMGKDLLYLISSSGNKSGAIWLKNVLGKSYQVHTTDQIYHDSHIDSTVICLRPGLVLLNATRVNEKNCPTVLNKWKKIWIDKIAPYPRDIIDFHRNVRLKIYRKLLKLGFETNLNNIHSEWVGMNLLSLDPNTVIVDKIQTHLIKKLEKKGLKCIPISFRNSYFLGGIHCVTLDTVRKSKL
jgi:glycine amidinotransferase/scyllo-inosamine-4-phosphate amidinotransferase 1